MNGRKSYGRVVLFLFASFFALICSGAAAWGETGDVVVLSGTWSYDAVSKKLSGEVLVMNVGTCTLYSAGAQVRILDRQMTQVASFDVKADALERGRQERISFTYANAPLPAAVSFTALEGFADT